MTFASCFCVSGLKDGIVIDIGGTTSDVGMLIGGFPREASTKVSVSINLVCQLRHLDGFSSFVDI